MLADQGKLSDEKLLRAEINRMLDDPKSAAFAQQFVGQWLGTAEVGARVAPDTQVFKGQFTSELLLDMQEEPVYFFRHLLRENRSLLELLDSDYLVVNDRLARHYKIVAAKPGEKNRLPSNPWVPDPKRGSGGPFKVVKNPNSKRGGVLGMGAVHMLTSYPNRTSAVLRGGWVLETLLGVRVPNPPPDIPELKIKKGKGKTSREQLAIHRDTQTCAACHNLMDPLGFALDSFDVLSRWREEEFGKPIDLSAKLPSGEVFEGPEGLRKTLLTRKDDFTRHLTRKMLGYSLGRSLSDADDCTIELITSHVIEHDYATRELVTQIVLSKPFRYRIAAPHSERTVSKPGDSK